MATSKLRLATALLLLFRGDRSAAHSDRHLRADRAIAGGRRLERPFELAAADQDSSEPEVGERSRRLTGDSAYYGYVESCRSYLLAPETVEDGLVSQSDFAAFLLEHCRSQQLCQHRFRLVFENLDVSIQLKFINGICRYGAEVSDRFECILELNSMYVEGNRFGFLTGDPQLEWRVEEMCSASFSEVAAMGLTRSEGERSAFLCKCDIPMERVLTTSTILLLSSYWQSKQPSNRLAESSTDLASSVGDSDFWPYIRAAHALPSASCFDHGPDCIRHESLAINNKYSVDIDACHFTATLHGCLHVIPSRAQSHRRWHNLPERFCQLLESWVV